MTAIKLQAQPKILSSMKLTEQDKTQSTHCGVVALISNSGIVTLNELVRDDNVVTVSQMKSQGKLTEVVMMVQLMLCEYLDNVSLRSSMNEKQIELAAGLMVEEHHHLPVQSFQLFFKECLCRRYGDHYGRMDIPTLMGWLQKFHENYDELVEEQAYAEHMSTKGDKGIDLMALAKSKEQGEEIVAMPESLQRAMHLKREETLADKIRAKVIKENSHLFSTLSFEDAQKQITSLINDELIKHNIFNLE